MSGGVLKYKKSTNKNWNIASNLEFVINELTQYDIIYEDQYKKSITRTVNVWMGSNGQIMIQ